jgi:hypothetical protein
VFFVQAFSIPIQFTAESGAGTNGRREIWFTLAPGFHKITIGTDGSRL